MQDTKRRSKKFIDKAVQGALMLRVARYWALSLCLVAGLTAVGWLFVWPGIPSVVGNWDAVAPLAQVLLVGLAVTIGLMPVVLFDLAKMSNRFVGPVYRMQRCLNDLADGKPVRPVKFRDEDYWHDLAAAFNRVLAAQQQQPAAPTKAEATAEPSEAAATHAEELQAV
ncbi:hypothetical protein Pla123a_09530 [Posidoniimonas polymericola]|uniref:HAMP domain-containing protein n=1 Tax=Posidoniimonas polymericola TaxID=2528002 RepID=A0A5C5YU00_9BACT|nr:hypothetical protein [Posidoniimonas polymericola]TWT78163.1 hypothetical protein Pla123a_09530 [Posidoniimonas polymericola]